MSRGDDISSGQTADVHIGNDESYLRETQRFAAIGQLTRTIVHNFNNLLGIVIGNIDLMRVHISAGEPLERYAAQALKGALRCADLTRGLLAFARQQPAEPKIVALDEVVSGVLQLAAPILGDSATIAYRAMPGLWPVTIDPQFLEAVLLNLIWRPHRQSGPRLLSIELANGPRDGQDTRFVVLTFTEPGSETPASTLSTIRAFMDEAAGHARIEENSPGPMILRLYFPASPVRVRAEALAREPRNPALASRERTILVVEDESDLRDIAVAALSGLGFYVLEAPDGDAALSLLSSREDIEFLFTDIMMPGMTGTELTARALKQRPGLKVLYTTGGDEKVRQTVRPDELLCKPYRAHELTSRIRDMLEAD